MQLQCVNSWTDQSLNMAELVQMKNDELHGENTFSPGGQCVPRDDDLGHPYIVVFIGIIGWGKHDRKEFDLNGRTLGEERGVKLENNVFLMSRE